MPIYEFRCQACGNEVEVLQKINDPHLTDCESCGKAEMKKKVTAAAFRLSGAGWYETDFKDGDKKSNLTETATDNSTKIDKDKNSNEKKENSKKGSDSSTDKTQEKTSVKKETTTKESTSSKNNKPASTD